MLNKSFPVEVKADGETGTFTALVSTFGNVDKVGDRVMPGAYTKTLARWKASGDPIPIILSHTWDDPWAHIGVADPHEAKQTERGLELKGTLDIGDNPVAKQVHKLMMRRSLKEFSIGYSVPAGGERRAKDGANELLEIDLAECGPCLKGIDPKTELGEVKSAVHEHARDTELQALKERLDALEQRLEKAETAGVKETPSRPAADPLEEKARALVMDVLTEGSRPPATVTTEEQPPGPDMEPDALKRRSRDLIVQLLTD